MDNIYLQQECGKNLGSKAFRGSKATETVKALSHKPGNTSSSLQTHIKVEEKKWTPQSCSDFHVVTLATTTPNIQYAHTHNKWTF